jgi:tRNA(adenine34) deaminase
MPEAKRREPEMPENTELSDEYLMSLALEEAEKAGAAGEIPVGAVVALDGEVLAAAGNARERTNDPTAHAEILAIREATRRLGTWRLEGATVAVTLEPCPMCAGALVNARVARLVYGCADPKAGAAYSLYNIVQDPRLNHSVEVVDGIAAERCAALLSAFFAKLRKSED